MATTVTGVTNHFPVAQDGFSTTTSSSVSSGATTVELNSVGNYSNGDIVVFIIDPTDSNKKQAFTGKIDTSGVRVTDVVWTSGTNQSHALGATVVDYETATHWSMMSKGMLVSHNQDGTIKDEIVTPENLVSGTGTSWAWQSWSPTWTNLTIGNATTKYGYNIIGKTVHCRFSVTFGSTTSISGQPTISLPVTAISSIYTAGESPLGICTLLDTGSVWYQGVVRYNSTTAANIIGINVAGTYASNVTLSSTVPFTWTTGDIIEGQFEYEAA